MRRDNAKLWTFIEPYVTDAGLELVELQFGRDREGNVLRVFIDFPWVDTDPDRTAGPPSAERRVGLAECERVSRDLSVALDVADLIPTSYQLEVSSPGIERPLRRERDFRRFAGRRARIRTEDPIDGRRNFSGVLLDARDGKVAIDCDGHRYDVPVSAVLRANLIPDWAAEFRRCPETDTEREDGRSAS